MRSTPKENWTWLYGFRLLLPRDVYKPSDDTYLLAENLRVEAGSVALEVGCGCGLIALLAAAKGGSVVATDINPSAVKATRLNAEQNGLASRVEVREGDLFQPVYRSERFDLIIFNPPYLPGAEEEGEKWILERAWLGGSRGLELTLRFIEQVADFLKPKGRLLLIQSTLSGGEETPSILYRRGFTVKVLAEKKMDFETVICIEAQAPS